MTKERFSREDLVHWQEKGLISAEQLQSILAEAELKTEPAHAERTARLNAVSVAYYFGGFLALLSFTFFLGISWKDIPDWAHLLITLAAMLVIGTLGVWLRFMRSYHIAGGLLLFVATAIFPLFVYTIAETAGLWPDTHSFSKLDFSYLYLSLASLPVAMAALILTRFSLISLLAASLLHMAAISAGEILDADGRVITAVAGGVFVLVGLALTLRGKKAYSFWLKLYGLAILLIAFIIISTDDDNALIGLIFLFVSLLLIFLSLRFREAIYLVFGSIGIYIYLLQLVFDTFEGTVYFPLLLGCLGVSIVVLAVLSQKYKARLFRRKE